MPLRQKPFRALLLPLTAILFVACAVQSKQSNNASPPDPAGEWRPLYKGSLDDFRIYFKGEGFVPDANAQDVFVAEPDQIHVREGKNGLIVTKSAYSHYHVRVQYRWGKTGGSENAGLMTHVDLASTVQKDNRPHSAEINMKRDEPGAILLAHKLGPFGWSFVEPDTLTYLAEDKGGQKHQVNPFGKRKVDARYPDGTPFTKPYGEWNTMEAIVRGADSLTVILNGEVVNEFHNLTWPTPEQTPGRPNIEGGIGLQSEGQEIFYRNFEIKPL